MNSPMDLRLLFAEKIKGMDSAIRGMENAAILTYPMWAIGTAMIIVNPYSGMVSSKAVYRLFGTAAGAIVATIITPHLINTPFLFMSVLAVWVGFCLYISLLDR